MEAARRYFFPIATTQFDCHANMAFAGFYEKELRFRSWMHYPPYSSLANVLVRSDKLDEALAWSGLLGEWFEGMGPREFACWAQPPRPSCG